MNKELALDIIKILSVFEYLCVVNKDSPEYLLDEACRILHELRKIIFEV